MFNYQVKKEWYSINHIHNAQSTATGSTNGSDRNREVVMRIEIEIRYHYPAGAREVLVRVVY